MSTTKASASPAEQHWLKVLGTLNELQARLFVAQRALELGRGGVSHLSRLTGMSRPTIKRGAAELEGKEPLPSAMGRVRTPGAGRKPIEETDPKLKRELARLIDESTAGDPMRRYCQELWIGEARSGGFLPIFFLVTAFDLNAINEWNTSMHQG